jgi:hypothetical protein
VSDGDFTGRLLDGETLVWSGRPGQGLRLTSRDGLLIPFSLMWGGFAVFWEATVMRTSAPFFFRLWGVPFVLIGLYLIAGRFAVDAWVRGKTHYAVTNRRILIARSPPFGNFISLNLNRLPDVELQEDATGRGTLRFGPASPLWGYRGFGGFAIWTPALDPTPQFIAIDNAQSVFNQIQNSIRSAA